MGMDAPEMRENILAGEQTEREIASQPACWRRAATLAALTFIDSWNNFLWPLIVTTSTSEMTLPLGLATFQGAHSTQWTLLMAGNVMSLVPMLLVFFLAQRYFIRSVASTGLAGT